MNKHNRYAWYIVWINALMGCSIAASFPQFSLTVGDLSQSVGIHEQILLGSDTVKSVGIVVSMLVSGLFYKKLGARKTFILALACTALPQFLIPSITSISLLMVIKFVQGFSSIIFPVFLLIIMEWIEEKQTGTATAVFNGVFYGGGGIGGTIAGFVIVSHGWVASYHVIGILQIVIGLLWLLTVKEKSREAKAPGQKSNGQPVCSDPSAANPPSETSGGLPISRLLAMPAVWLLCLALFSTTFTLQAITVDMPVFGSALGYDQMATGQIMTAVTIGMLISCLASGKISDLAAQRTKEKARARILVLSIGPLLIILSAILLIVLPVTQFLVFYIATLLFSFGAAWGLGTFYAVLPEMFDRDTLPLITGFAGGIGDTGMPLAPFIVGVVFGINGLWHLGWATCALTAVLSLVACLLLLKKQKV